MNALLHASMDIFLYPPDVVRTRMQVQVLGEGRKDVKLSYPQYNSTWHCFRTIVAQEGIRGLYKGFAVAECTYIAGNMFHYGGYEIVKERLQAFMGEDASHKKFHIFWTTFCAGALADAASLSFVVPAEVVQQRLQIQGPLSEKTYKGGIDAFLKIARSEGVRGLYRGAGATFLLYAPASAIWWAVYELCKDWVGKYDLRSPLGIQPYQGGATGGNLQDQDPIVHAISGAAASFWARVFMNPIDIAKTRLQTQDVYALGGPRHRTTFSILYHMFRYEGFRAAFKGLLPALMSSIPSGIATITIYEWVKKRCLKKEYLPAERQNAAGEK